MMNLVDVLATCTVRAIHNVIFTSFLYYIYSEESSEHKLSKTGYIKNNIISTIKWADMVATLLGWFTYSLRNKRKLQQRRWCSTYTCINIWFYIKILTFSLFINLSATFVRACHRYFIRYRLICVYAHR